MKEKKLETIVPADDEEGVDRISILIEPLVHHIMSFLPTVDVSITSALSKRFHSLWSSFPIISFDENLFIENSGRLDLYPSQARDTFLDFVVGSIQLRLLQTNLEKFSLKCDLGEIKSDPRVDMAINFALDNNVRDLYLNFFGHGFNDVRYNLKETFYLKSVIFLTLKGFELNLNWLVSNIPLMQSLSLCHCFVSEENINFSGNITSTVGQSLRLLSFMNVNITEMWFENYICRFPELENLQMSGCPRLKNLRLSHESLKEFELNENSNLVSLEIVAPKLVSFQYIGRATKACTINIAACKLIKYLSLKGAHVTDEWLISQVSSFLRLEKLSLENCVKLVRIQITSNHLQMLELRDCEKLVEVNIDAENLQCFEYSGVLAYLSLMNSPRLRKPTLKIISDVLRSDVWLPPTNGWFAGLRDFLTMFDHCEALTLFCSFYQDMIFPMDLRYRTLSPLYDIKSLHIKSSCVPNIKSELIDSLLWISPKVETICFASEFVEKIIKDRLELQFFQSNGPVLLHFCKKLRYKRKRKTKMDIFCCNHLPVKCWRHYLKGVEMQNFDKSDDIDVFIHYFKKECKYVGNSLHQFMLL